MIPFAWQTVSLTVMVSLASPADAQKVASFLDCRALRNDEIRLRCFDHVASETYGGVSQSPRHTAGIQAAREALRDSAPQELSGRWSYPPTTQDPQPTDSSVVKPKDDPAWLVRVRNSATLSPVGDSVLGTDPALFQVGRTNGDGFYSAKVAVFAMRNRPLRGTWEPFIGVSWTRDTLPGSPKDLRQGVLGLTGELLTPKLSDENGLAVLGTFRLARRSDKVLGQDQTAGNAHFEAIYFPWVSDPVRDGSNSRSILPFGGVLVRSLGSAPSGPADGVYAGTYLGGKVEWRLGGISPRLTATARGQLFKDARTPKGGSSSSQRFGSLGIEYFLGDPDSRIGWVPSLSFIWQSGSDPVTGIGSGRKTVFALGARYN